MPEAAIPVQASAASGGGRVEHRSWSALIEGLHDWCLRQEVSPSRLVVLMPYAQLMAAGQRAWAQRYPSGFAPRFESTRNWAHNLQPFAPGSHDFSGDIARDSLIAAALIDQVARHLDVPLRAVMVSRLLDATRQLMPLAAAVAPEDRVAWAQLQREALGTSLAGQQWEALIASLALSWAGSSAWATDVLWGPLGAPGLVADRLVLVPGLQPDFLSEALVRRWGDKARVWPLPDGAPPAEAPFVQLHASDSAEDEAKRAAACVIQHLNAGRQPVALVATDRLLTRRVSALLDRVGVSLRDETGWKLSTTHAAAQVMAWLRAADGRASADEVLEALKLAPRWNEKNLRELEHQLRQHGLGRWRAAVQHLAIAPLLPEGLMDVLASLEGRHGLEDWLSRLAQTLAQTGLWSELSQDAAGQQLLEGLRLMPGASTELRDLGLVDDSAPVRRSTWSLASFTAWVRDALEGARFQLPGDAQAQVVILPMAQLMGRDFAATVAPGCDEVSLPTHPEPPAPWTPAQRETLGLASRVALAEAAVRAWSVLLASPQVDLLWRRQDRGEVLAPNRWVQALWEQAGEVQAHDPRLLEQHEPQPQSRPAPSAPALLPDALSASAYQDLRDCPYRFFALRQLRLYSDDEIESEPDQRDMGNWLHAVLRAFHESRGDQRPGRAADSAELDTFADEISRTMGLTLGEEGAGFMPYRAVWPALREGYLDWLADYEATAERPGPRFERAEAELTQRAGRWKLMGQLDRIDRQDSPEGAIPFVIDYKTESRTRSLDRVKMPLEDTQLAFYAALLPDETVRAAYLSITDQRGDKSTLLIEQPEVLMARDELRAGLAHDLDRIADGAVMPALGEGRVCEYCAARGLCRKDDWAS